MHPDASGDILMLIKRILFCHLGQLAGQVTIKKLWCQTLNYNYILIYQINYYYNYYILI